MIRSIDRRKESVGARVVPRVKGGRFVGSRATYLGLACQGYVGQAPLTFYAAHHRSRPTLLRPPTTGSQGKLSRSLFDWGVERRIVTVVHPCVQVLLNRLSRSRNIFLGGFPSRRLFPECRPSVRTERDWLDGSSTCTMEKTTRQPGNKNFNKNQTYISFVNVHGHKVQFLPWE